MNKIIAFLSLFTLTTANAEGIFDSELNRMHQQIQNTIDYRADRALRPPHYQYHQYPQHYNHPYPHYQPYPSYYHEDYSHSYDNYPEHGYLGHRYNNEY